MNRKMSKALEGVIFQPPCRQSKEDSGSSALLRVQKTFFDTEEQRKYVRWCFKFTVSKMKLNQFCCLYQRQEELAHINSFLTKLLLLEMCASGFLLTEKNKFLYMVGSDNNFVDMLNYKCAIMYIIWYKVLFTVFRANIKIIFGGLVFTVTPRSAIIIL
jgi:hypothetical protein